jgi:hypothetical protein
MVAAALQRHAMQVSFCHSNLVASRAALCNSRVVRLGGLKVAICWRLPLPVSLDVMSIFHALIKHVPAIIGALVGFQEREGEGTATSSQAPA